MREHFTLNTAFSNMSGRLIKAKCIFCPWKEMFAAPVNLERIEIAITHHYKEKHQ